MLGLLNFRMGRVRYLVWTLVCLPVIATAGPFAGPGIVYDRAWTEALAYVIPLLWAVVAGAPRLRDAGLNPWFVVAPLAAFGGAGFLRTSWGGGATWAPAASAGLVFAALGFVMLLAVKGPRRETMKQVFS